MRSAPPHREAGKRAQRFVAASSVSVIRVDLMTTGASVRLACGWAPRITMGEVAATNRRARFPAARHVGVLRIASAPDLARPPVDRRVQHRDGASAPRVSFAATSDSRDSRSGKARPQRDCRAGLGTQRGSQNTMRRAQLFHATPPQRASVRVGDPGSAGARTRCALQVADRADLTK